MKNATENIVSWQGYTLLQGSKREVASGGHDSGTGSPAVRIWALTADFCCAEGVVDRADATKGGGRKEPGI